MAKSDTFDAKKIQESAHIAMRLGISPEAFEEGAKKWTRLQSNEAVALLDDANLVCDVARSFDIGMTLQKDGAPALCFYVESQSGEQIVVPVTTDSAMKLIEVAAVHLEAKHVSGTARQLERMEVASRLKSVFNEICNLDTRHDIYMELHDKFKIDELSRLKTLEERAESEATKKVAAQVRRMATALTTTDSAEKHALIDELSPFIRKAFEG